MKKIINKILILGYKITDLPIYYQEEARKLIKTAKLYSNRSKQDYYVVYYGNVT